MNPDKYMVQELYVSSQYYMVLYGINLMETTVKLQSPTPLWLLSK